MKKILFITLSVSLAFTLLSCKSKPEAEEAPKEAPAIEQPEEVEVKKLDDLTTQNEGISNEKESVNNEQLLAEMISSIDEARNLAIEAGAENLAAAQLASVDAAYEAAKSNYDSLSAGAFEKKYQALSDYSNAKSLKQQIDENDLAKYAKSKYEEGITKLQIVEEAFEAQSDITAEVEAAIKEAYSSFNTVYTIAYKKLAQQERTSAMDAKKSADSVKAAVSRKEQYKEAAQLLQDGDSIYSMQNPKKAYEKYIASKDLFEEMYKDVAEKRAAAQKALEEAKKRVAESASFAERADADTPITEDVEGIEEEDAVLLEEDEYENPEEAVIEITTTIEMDEAEIAEEAVEEDDEGEEPAEPAETVEETTDIPEEAIIETSDEEDSIDDALIEEELSEMEATQDEAEEEQEE